MDLERVAKKAIEHTHRERMADHRAHIERVWNGEEPVPRTWLPLLRGAFEEGVVLPRRRRPRRVR